MTLKVAVNDKKNIGTSGSIEPIVTENLTLISRAPSSVALVLDKNSSNGRVQYISDESIN